MGQLGRGPAVYLQAEVTAAGRIHQGPWRQPVVGPRRQVLGPAGEVVELAAAVGAQQVGAHLIRPARYSLTFTTTFLTGAGDRKAMPGMWASCGKRIMK